MCTIKEAVCMRKALSARHHVGFALHMDIDFPKQEAESFVL